MWDVGNISLSGVRYWALTNQSNSQVRGVNQLNTKCKVQYH